MLPYHFEQLVALVLEALKTQEKRASRLARVTFHGCRCQRNKKKRSQAIIRLSILWGQKFKRRVTFENQESVMCHWGRASFFSRWSPCVWPSADWQQGMGVCVGGDRIHLLSAWLYMVCFVFASLGQHWHIEVFISRKQVTGRGASLCAWVCFYACLGAYISALHQLVYCMHIMEGVHVSACMWVNVHSYISVCVIFGGLLQRRINQWCLG